MNDRYHDELPAYPVMPEWDCEIDDSPEVMEWVWWILMTTSPHD
jgi:hypothetical protein